MSDYRDFIAEEQGVDLYDNKEDLYGEVRCMNCANHEDCICVVCEDGYYVVCTYWKKHVFRNGNCMFGREM